MHFIEMNLKHKNRFDFLSGISSGQFKYAKVKKESRLHIKKKTRSLVASPVPFECIHPIINCNYEMGKNDDDR